MIEKYVIYQIAHRIMIIQIQIPKLYNVGMILNK